MKMDRNSDRTEKKQKVTGQKIDAETDRNKLKGREGEKG